MLLFRHGDVDIRQIVEIPKVCQKTQTKTVAYGEATGHHHTFNGGQVIVYDAPIGHVMKVGNETISVTKFVDVLEATKLEHQEHKAIEIPRGTYAISIEREYNPFAEQSRQVLD